LESYVLNVVAPLVRWVHLAACVGLAGIAVFLLLAGRSPAAGDDPAIAAWRIQMARWSRSLVVVAIAAGVLMLANQAIVFEGRAGAAVDGTALARVLLDTQWGLVWLLRHALLLLLAAYLAVSTDESRRADWIASRGQALVLGVGALALFAASGHAAAIEPDTRRAIGVAALHLLATGIWVGGLPALASLLSRAADHASADAHTYTARATRRFSNAALASVLVLAVTGIVNAVWHVASVAALVGTPYGRLLLLKLALLAVILALAAIARTRIVPAIVAGGAEVRAPFKRLHRIAVGEGALAALILLVVAIMGLTKPGRHDQPTWPFAFRLVPSAQAAAKLALPTTVVDASPTTYMRPAVPYTAASIVVGAALYQQHCAACHGAAGAGDGPLAAGSSAARPVDLRSPRVRARTAGDLFWSIGNGVASVPAHAFADRTSAEQRWDLVNYIRTLEAADLAKDISPSGEGTQPLVV
jgi:putative copper export protein/mono/diheme cytochrome c family protein